MSKVVNIGAAEERLDTASRWVARMDRGLTDAERAELQDWIAADPKNAERLMSLTQRWDRMESLSRLAELFPEPRDSRVRQRSGRRWVGAAVMVTLIVAVAAAWVSRQGVEAPITTPEIAELHDTYKTEIGEQTTESLADGSILAVNTNSLVRVEFSSHARVLRLERGEIHVEVAEDTERPFSVIAGGRIVQAIGTAFSVEITDDQQIELVVTEGKVVVGVSGLDGPPVGAPPRLVQSSTNTVQAGEELVLGAPEETVKSVSAEDIEVKLSWREGRLIFRGEPLDAALAEVERYTTVQFVFLDDDIRTREVVGRFRADDVESLLLALRLNFDIAYEHVDDGRVLLSSL